MASSAATMSPFSQAVVKAMRKLCPEELADKSFDNTGLLLESPHRPHLKDHALLTVDLTTAVANEAIQKNSSIVISYHPIIFRALKSLTLANTQQKTLLRLAQEGISVYSPHTAIDATPGGITDWLVDVVTGQTMKDKNQPVIGGLSRSTITVLNPHHAPPVGFEKAGYGRKISFLNNPPSLETIIARVKHATKLEHLSLAVPSSLQKDFSYDYESAVSNTKIHSVGVCPGSGSMLNGADVELLVTGELSHHEALAAAEQGKFIITTLHSNSERGFLVDRMLGNLTEELKTMSALGGQGEGIGSQWMVECSEVDRDPFRIV